MVAIESDQRGIIVPLSEESLLHFRKGDVSSKDEFEIIEIDDGLFFLLWHVGVFKKVNEICGSLVDDYEEEEVKDNLEELQSTIYHWSKKRGLGTELVTFLEQFERLIGIARKKNMPILFLL